MGAAVKPFKCNVCGHSWTGNGGCDHYWHRENANGDSFTYEHISNFYASSDEENNMEEKQSAFDSIILAIAIACHEANRRYCDDIGEEGQVMWDDAPEWQRKSAIKGVTGHLLGDIATPEQSHESWLKEKQDTGRVYGEVKDPVKKTHPSMVAYGDLPPAERKKDSIFSDVVRETYRAMRLDFDQVKLSENI
jgi:hypothetical protein